MNNQFIESFFDENDSSFKLWTKKVKNLEIDTNEIIYKGKMSKINRKTNKTKERFFILTKNNLYYLKNEKSNKIRGLMKIEWVRTEYIEETITKEKMRYCIRFIKNLKYCDFIVNQESCFEIWKEKLSKVFIQSDFHTKFNAIKMIGKGSFARVYLVEDTKSGIKYAVKAFSKEYLQSQIKGKESLMNEISIMKELNHENIMKLEEIHESKNSIYLVLELLEGGELFNYISSRNKLTVKEVTRIMKCLLEALKYLDAKGIMHRDLKPENMILKEKSEIENCHLKLVDFGLSTFCDVDEYLFKRCGTPGYVAPEIINASSKSNVKYNSNVDVFSAGIIFYILIMGRAPFKGKSFEEILNQNKLCKIDLELKKIKENPDVHDLMKKMLEVDPNNRISAKEALEHNFFKNEEHENIGDIEFEENDLKNLKTDINKKPDDTDSFVVRDNVINGKLDTVNETTSKGGIQSLKGMENKKNSNTQRASIYKYVLTKDKEVSKN